MGPEVTHLAASVAKLQEVDRSPHASQRASDLAQGRLADESAAAFGVKKTNPAEHLQKEKIRQDRERRRRELERRAAHTDASDQDVSDSDGGIFDVVA